MKKLLFAITLCSLAGSATATTATDSLTVRIEGMRCAHCAQKVSGVIDKLQGIDSYDFNLERRTASIAFDKQKTSADSIRAALDATERYKTAPYSADEVILRKVSLHIDDMHCDKCAHKILTALDSVEGIDSMAPHVAEHNFLICYDANRTTKGDIRKAVTGAGYTPVAHYASENAAYAYFVIPKEKTTSETTDAALTIEGVNDANVNARRGALAITYISNKTSVQQLLEALKLEGIDAAVPPAHKCKEKESGRKE